MSLSLVKI